MGPLRIGLDETPFDLITMESREKTMMFRNGRKECEPVARIERNPVASCGESVPC
jgi:hypothetical protein